MKYYERFPSCLKLPELNQLLSEVHEISGFIKFVTYLLQYVVSKNRAVTFTFDKSYEVQ